MAPFGPVWPHLALFGSIWTFLVPFGAIFPHLPCLAPLGHILISISRYSKVLIQETIIASFFGPLQVTYYLFFWTATGDSLPVSLAHYRRLLPVFLAPLA